jgi:hypothetical protein
LMDHFWADRARCSKSLTRAQIHLYTNDIGLATRSNEQARFIADRTNVVPRN